MNLKLILVASLVIVLFVGLSIGETDDLEAEIEECKRLILSLVGKQLDSIKMCLKEMHFESKKERASKMMCVLKCSMIKEGFLDAEGALDLTGSLGILNSFSTQTQTKILNYLMAHCNQYVGDIDPQQVSCKSYEPMVRCAHDMLNNVCV